MGAADVLSGMRELPINVPFHAATSGANRAGLTCEQIRSEVGEALQAGRQSRERPPWLKPGADAEAGCVYCWPGHERHAYVVCLAGAFTVVRTVLTPSLARRDFRRCQGKPALAQAMERAGA
jgi:hypothetical protein